VLEAAVSWCRARVRLGDSVVGETGLVPEDERVAGTESDVAIWGVTIFDVAKAELRRRVR